MFCFNSSLGKNERKRHKEMQQSLQLKFSFPSLASQYLPKLSEVQVQNDSEEIIDDPSIIFYDPYEKPGFVYKAVPFISKGFDFSYQQPAIEESFSHNSKVIRKSERVDIQDDLVSLVFDDSLDGTSFPNTPLLLDKEHEVFNKDFDVSSRRDSLEFDNMLESDQLANIDNFIPGMESTRNMELHESIHQISYQENSFADAYEGINLYEDNLQNNKGYISDAESVKTYQDSGIYDDDMESPKAEGYSRVARQLMFGTPSERFDTEKFSAFKTPMSSKQSSIDSLVTANEDITKTQPKQQTKAKQDTSYEQSKPIRSCNKYSYVQAKVQCHRTKGERSPSPGDRLRSQSVGANHRQSSHKNFTNNIINNIINNHGTKSSSEQFFENKPVAIKTTTTKRKPKMNKDYNQRNKVFTEKLTFRERAKSRTDTHGVEMYSNLPKEFQEIARRLQRQDRELKKSETDLRGRSLSRRSSRVSSRASSLSPTHGRKSRRSTEKQDNLATEYFLEEKDTTISKQLSRSSSIRSIPSTPAISRQHPLPSLQHGKSASVSPGRSPAHRPASAESNATKTKDDKRKEKRTKSWTPTSNVNRLYTFTTVNDSFGTSPISGNNPMFHVVHVR